MIHVVLNITKSYDLGTDREVGCAFVELTPDFCREMLRRMDLFTQLKTGSEGDLSDLVYWDTGWIQYLATELVPEEYDREGIPEEFQGSVVWATRRHLPLTEADMVDDVEFPMLFVDADVIFWRAYEKDMELYMDTPAIERSMLEWALREQTGATPIIVS